MGFFELCFFCGFSFFFKPLFFSFAPFSYESFHLLILFNSKLYAYWFLKVTITDMYSFLCTMKSFGSSQKNVCPMRADSSLTFAHVPTQSMSYTIIKVKHLETYLLYHCLVFISVNDELSPLISNPESVIQPLLHFLQPCAPSRAPQKC